MPKTNTTPAITPNGGVQVDSLSGDFKNASGSVATRLLDNGFNPDSLRTNAVLTKEAWVSMDTAIVETAKERMLIVGDLISRGLTYELAEAMGVTKLEWQRVGEVIAPQASMAAESLGQRDRLGYDLRDIAIPIIHQEFTLDIRTLRSSQRAGQPLDTALARAASRSVSDFVEGSFFDGMTVSGQANKIPGLFTSTANGGVGAVVSSLRNWASNATTGEQIVEDILDLIEAQIEMKHYGPYVLYTGYNSYTNMLNDYKASSDKTILQRVLEIPQVSAVMPTGRISNTASAGSRYALVELTNDTVDIINGIQPTMVEWDSQGGLVTNYKVIAIMLPRFREDMNGNTGITKG